MQNRIQVALSTHSVANQTHENLIHEIQLLFFIQGIML